MAVSKDAALIKITEVLSSQKFAVVATDADDHIHTSLVCYTVSKDLKFVYFATPRTTRKYRFLKKNRKIGINISDSRNDLKDTHNAYAVTAYGEAIELYDDVKDETAAELIFRFNHLDDFYKDPLTAVISVKISEYSITSNFQNVSIIKMKDL